jgi:hypothetical protein
MALRGPRHTAGRTLHHARSLSPARSRWGQPFAQRRVVERAPNPISPAWQQPGSERGDGRRRIFCGHATKSEPGRAVRADADAGSGRMRKTALWAALLFPVCCANGVLAESVSAGTPAHGSLKNGVSLPHKGEGLVTYSRLGNLLGRRYVHSRVQDTLLAAFSSLHATRPERIFVMGETRVVAWPCTASSLRPSTLGASLRSREPLALRGWSHLSCAPRRGCVTTSTCT